MRSPPAAADPQISAGLLGHNHGQGAQESRRRVRERSSINIVVLLVLRLHVADDRHDEGHEGEDEEELENETESPEADLRRARCDAARSVRSWHWAEQKQADRRRQALTGKKKVGMKEKPNGL